MESPFANGKVDSVELIIRTFPIFDNKNNKSYVQKQKW